MKKPASNIVHCGAVPKTSQCWLTSGSTATVLAARIDAETSIALDVETTLADQRLCLIQIGTAAASYLIDPFTVGELEPLAEILASARIEKIIHNAQFEQTVLGKLGIAIENVCDTLALSRKRYGPLAGGHSLLAAVRRELDVTIDKRCQTSDWTLRPLSSDQERYAALDVELLLGLRDALAARQP